MNNWTEVLRHGEAGIEALMAALESVLISVVGRVGLWLTPLPSAFLVSRSASRVFDLVGVWPVIMAAIVELVGLACSHLWLSAREWNASKNKTDPEANERLAFGLMLTYFVVTGALLLAFELPVVLSTGNVTGLTALLFPVLSAVAVVALNERAMQHRRVSDKVSNKLSKNVSTKASRTVQHGVQNGVLDRVNVSKRERKSAVMDSILDIYLDSPNVSATEVADRLDISRSAFYNYLSELEATGRITRNGSGVKVVEG